MFYRLHHLEEPSLSSSGTASCNALLSPKPGALDHHTCPVPSKLLVRGLLASQQLRCLLH